jgi:hypothetical protein
MLLPMTVKFNSRGRLSGRPAAGSLATDNLGKATRIVHQQSSSSLITGSDIRLDRLRRCQTAAAGRSLAAHRRKGRREAKGNTKKGCHEDVFSALAT